MLVENKPTESLNVCIITSWFPNKKNPRYVPFVYLFGKSLAEVGFKVSFIVPLVGDDEPVTSKDGITIYRIKGKFYPFSMIKLVKRIMPDVIHVQAPDFFSSIAIIAAAIMKIPIIATVHRGELEDPAKLMSLVRKFAYPRFRKIVAVSEFTKSLTRKTGAKMNNVVVIYNSCNQQLFLPRDKLTARKNLGLPIDKKIILYVGNLVKIKGIYTLIESCRIICAKIPDSIILIVGDGIERTKVESLVTSYGLDNNIKFLKSLEPSKIPPYYNSADTFILPSFIEGHSVALLEAMSSGLPIVASMVGGNKETVEDGVNGFLFEAGCSDMLAQKTIKILTDDSVSRQMSLRSSEIYQKKFTTQIQIQSFVKLYRSLL